jgi:signal transduction histidine kinase
MLAGVLHDLRTPMTIISGYAQLMAQMDDAEQREAYVDQILRQFDFMSGMTREVLAFSRGETEVLIRRVFLHRFFDEVATQLEHAMAGRNITLRVDAKYNGTAYFDEQKVMRIIHNLARNAADAMPGGGELSVLSSLEGEGREGEEILLLEVVDNGPGIPVELEGRLFEMFATGRKGGTGLGLAIVKKIVDDHQGTIRYVSRPGEGTRFLIRLPRKRLDATEDILEQTAH